MVNVAKTTLVGSIGSVPAVSRRFRGRSGTQGSHARCVCLEVLFRNAPLIGEDSHHSIFEFFCDWLTQSVSRNT